VRIVVRIGGSVVANPINTELMGKYADMIKPLDTRHEVTVILARSFSKRIHRLAKNLGLDMNAQDEVQFHVLDVRHVLKKLVTLAVAECSNFRRSSSILSEVKSSSWVA